MFWTVRRTSLDDRVLTVHVMSLSLTGISYLRYCDLGP